MKTTRSWLVLLGLGLASYAQTVTPATCTDTKFQWAFNSRNQSPCDVAGYLGGVCNAGQFTLPALTQEGQFYKGPDVATANQCRCNTVFYSMLSACASCQDRTFIKWSSFATNCTTVYLTYPETIPSGTLVPGWAYLDVTTSDIWNTTQASENSNVPESSGIPKSTGLAPPAPTSPSPSNTAESQSSSQSKSNAGAIAGGVVGGVVFLVIIAGIAFWLYRRRKTHAEDSISQYVSSGPNYNSTRLPPTSTSPRSDQTRFGSPSPEMGQKLPYYNPSDPNTFPDALARMQSPVSSGTYTSHVHSNSIDSTNAGNNHDSSLYSTPTHHRNYSGAAEI
ncbi:hypothetical protein Moror_7953 [Moniliophthora roreri MCA 2997]|uniref:Uncharacterized protein n=2 Tax=Moniliophthora roreri TaxID=221103 RepID=V2XP02_MONRO|nr:hypothetical protein Moror_7953 [Moniliophthora roreri MCA 2997]KAI3610732.1 hypothetical protein WG66_006857 [Moniliophthora roreri]